MSGLLAHGLSYGNELRKRLRSLLTDPIPYTQEALNTALPPVEELAAQGRQMQATGKVPAEIDPRLMDLGMGLLGAIKVYHGSPYAFTKADSSKIGTGQGDMLAGHGLNWSENPAAATAYRRLLSGGKITDPKAPADVRWADAAKLNSTTPQEAKGFVKQLADRSSKNEGPPKGFNSWDDFIKSTNQRIDETYQDAPGYLYEANLRWPDPQKEAASPLKKRDFLDWDRKVTTGQRAILEKEFSGFDPKDKFSDFHRKLVREYGAEPEEIAIELKKLGFPGITYLGHEAGTVNRNYVTFDDALVELLKRNGGLLGGGTREPTVSAMKRAIDLVGEKEFKKSVAYRLKELGPLSPEEQAAEIEGVARSLLEYLGAGK